MNKKAIERALAIVERGIVPYQPPHPFETYVPREQHLVEARQAPSIEVIDLPRICALHQKPFMSRYLRSYQGYDYQQSIRVTESLYRGQYEGNQALQDFDNRFLGHEHCPWCGSYSDDWSGVIRCTSCNRFMCYGTTVRNFFRCPCGHSGQLRGDDYGQTGVVPAYRNYGSGGL